MFNKVLELIGIRRDLGAPVYAGANPIYFTDVYFDGAYYIFSWRTPDHTRGGSKNYFTREDAEQTRRYWEAEKELIEHADFVREG